MLCCSGTSPIADTDAAGLVYADDALLQSRATQEDMDRCSEELVSFRPETGTYLATGGEVRVCPYLE